LNLGHGVMQGTPEEAVGWLVDECKRYKGKE
jgi:uroporphyrinogen-III decarboxylase